MCHQEAIICQRQQRAETGRAPRNTVIQHHARQSRLMQASSIKTNLFKQIAGQ
jgi:hypothetical protein